MKSKEYIYTIALFFIAAIIITLLIPSGGHYMQKFNVGEKWDSETLTAPFDFAISKTNVEISADRRLYGKNFIPVYSHDTSIYQTIENSDLNARTKEFIRFVYSKGVVANFDKSSIEDDKGMSYIRVNDNSVLRTISTGEIFTIDSARAYVLQNSKEPIDNLGRFIVLNLSYNEALNAVLRDREIKNVAITKGIVHENELIVSANQTIDKEIFGKLNSLKLEYEKRIGGGNSYLWILSGHFMVVVIVLLITFLFLYYFKTDFIGRFNNVIFILLLYVFMAGICSMVSGAGNLSIYIVPFAIVPIYILTFYDVRMSVYEHATVLLLCSLMVSQPMEFFFINFVAGIVGVFVLKRSYRRERIFMAIGAIFLCNCVSYLAMNIIQYGGVDSIDGKMGIWFVVNALLFLGMYQLIYVIEKVFGFVSDVTLLELCDTNQKLLLELAHKAPGTFQHTIQVANLAEAAAKEIGANPLLARTGALYHDIGKMNNPAYFIENTSGTFNPHNDITPSESAEIIRKHVTDGVYLAKKQGIPQVIIDFITGHHGDSLIYYFYAAQKELRPEIADMSEFCYPGPKPISKEVSICMMADSIEAASRSLNNYTMDVVNELVNKIVDIQIREGQLSDSKLSFSDISTIKDVFINKLYNIYHTRITYPERIIDEQ